MNLPKKFCEFRPKGSKTYFYGDLQFFEISGQYLPTEIVLKANGYKWACFNLINNKFSQF